MIESIQTATQTQLQAIRAALLAGFQKGGSFALWRRPNQHAFEVILDPNDPLRKIGLSLESASRGFIVHPFEDQPDQQAYFIKCEEYFTIPLQQDNQEISLPTWVSDSETAADPQEIKRYLAEIQTQDQANSIEEEGKKAYMELIRKSTQAILSGQLEKVVPARSKTLPLPENFDLGRCILDLHQAYPNAFINFFHIPEVGTWLGASPELLMETRQDIFYTMSLAGTQIAQGENPLKTVAWTQKEIEEQALVSRYIVDCFKKIRLREYEEHGPKTVKAGDLLHLRSDFKVDMKETNFPQLGSVMLQLLHPTSAVCGMPRKEAHVFLKKEENLDRQFFAGFLGPINFDNQSSLYVNLRTASFSDGKITLFAGAGVTEDSIPEKEWEETELKCNILGKFLHTN